jgi:AcrR family transcriptional regulator
VGPKADISAERRQQIFQAALSCFARTGYYQTTMDDIAAESGLSKGTLYWYFDSKKNLFLALFQELIGQLGQSWEAIATSPDVSATEKLVASMGLFRSELTEMAPFFGIMMEAWALTRHDKDVESAIRDLYQPYLGVMERIIQEGVASGEFDFQSERAMALVVMTLYDGITLALATGLWEEDWAEVMDAAEVLVLRGLGVTRERDTDH